MLKNKLGTNTKAKEYIKKKFPNNNLTRNTEPLYGNVVIIHRLFI